MKRSAFIFLMLSSLFFYTGSVFSYEVKSLEDRRDLFPSSIVEVPEIRKNLEASITVDFRDVNLDYVIDFLSEATGVNIILGSGVKPEEKKVTIKVRDMTLESLLKYILRNQGLAYRIEKNAVWVDTFDAMEEEDPEKPWTKMVTRR